MHEKGRKKSIHDGKGKEDRLSFIVFSFLATKSVCCTISKSINQNSFIPPHIIKPKECKKLYMINLSEHYMYIFIFVEFSTYNIYCPLVYREE